MQNKANLPDDQMNVTAFITKDYEKKTLGGSGKNKANSKPNKANLQKAKINVTTFLTKEYENISNCSLAENKPNTNPIQTQTKPISPPPAAKQTQYKPNQTQFQTMSQNADSLVNFSIQLLYYHIDNHDTKNGKSFDHKGLICDYILQFDLILLSEPLGAVLV